MRNMLVQSIVVLMFLTACASNADKSSSVGAKMSNEFGECLKSKNFFNGQVIIGKTTDCATDFYNNINRLIPDTDRFKPAGLNMTRKMFILLSDFDNGKITDRRSMQKDFLRINNETMVEADEIATMVAADRAIQSERRRRMFIEAQNFMRLSTPGYGSTVKTCTPSPGAPTGTLVCN
jgi:hypothetical protein